LSNITINNDLKYTLLENTVYQISSTKERISKDELKIGQKVQVLAGPKGEAVNVMVLQ